MLTEVVSPTKVTAASVLDAVFQGNAAKSGPGSAEEIDVHVIPQGDEPRWIIVGSPKKALPVLKSWAPWKTASRVRWSGVRAAAAINALPMIPGVENSRSRIDVSYWRGSLPFFPESWNAVIHVGSFSHTRKAILFLIENGERILCAVKVPLMAGAAGAILNEGAILDRLRRFEYLPHVLFRDGERGVVAQSWLEGKPVGRKFTTAHLDLLNSLSTPGVAPTMADCRNEIARGLGSADLPFDRSPLARGLEMLDFNEPLPRFIEHRDFAPWNLKWMPSGALGLLDWEWAEADGLPWQDVCRYFYLDDVHFNGGGRVWEAMNSNDLLRAYLNRFEIPLKALPALTMRYLLRELLMEWNGGNVWLAKYAYGQIQALIESARPVRA